MLSVVSCKGEGGIVTIEVNRKFQPANNDTPLEGGLMVSITPDINADYFIARVPLFQDQSIVIFPKFGTIGCGFAQEEDWNTNLPIRSDAKVIYDHIAKNKKYPEITEEQCIEAIRMLQAWAEANR